MGGRFAKGLVVSLFGLGLAVGAAFAWYQQTIGTPYTVKDTTLLVPKGASSQRVLALLQKEKLIPRSFAFRVWLKTSAVRPPLAGRHRLSGPLTIGQMFDVLAQTPLSEDVPVTMVEGWRLSDADQALSKSGRIAPGDYLRASTANLDKYKIPFPFQGKDLSGFLLPDTYMMPPGPIDCRQLVQRQLDAFAERFYRPYKAELSKTKRQLRDLVIMASLLEREEPNPAIRPKVAGVLYNRLDANQALGVDATSRFTLTNWSDRKAFLKKLRDPNDPWNTRLKAGLPPGPIGAPSLDSLRAALRPGQHSYWYYLHDKNGQIHFSKNAREHEAKRKRYNVW